MVQKPGLAAYLRIKCQIWQSHLQHSNLWIMAKGKLNALPTIRATQGSSVSIRIDSEIDRILARLFSEFR